LVIPIVITIYFQGNAGMPPGMGMGMGMGMNINMNDSMDLNKDVEFVSEQQTIEV